jgi:hypothetical protein
MRWVRCTVALLTCLGCSESRDDAVALLSPRHQVLGLISPRDAARVEWRWRNNTHGPIRVVSATPTCSCVRVESSPGWVSAGAVGVVVARVELAMGRYASPAISIVFSDGSAQVVTCEAAGATELTTIATPSVVDFGEVVRGSAGTAECQIELIGTRVTGGEVLSVDSDSLELHGRFGESRALSDLGPLKRFAVPVHLTWKNVSAVGTTMTSRVRFGVRGNGVVSTCELRVSGRSRGSVEVSPRDTFLASVPVGVWQEARVRVNSIDGSPLRLALVAANPDFRVSANRASESNELWVEIRPSSIGPFCYTLKGAVHRPKREGKVEVVEWTVSGVAVEKRR